VPVSRIFKILHEEDSFNSPAFFQNCNSLFHGDGKTGNTVLDKVWLFHSGETLPLKCWWLSIFRGKSIWRWSQQVPPKRWYHLQNYTVPSCRRLQSWQVKPIFVYVLSLNIMLACSWHFIVTGQWKRAFSIQCTQPWS
jgi:hypothetical protein